MMRLNSSHRVQAKRSKSSASARWEEATCPTYSLPRELWREAQMEFHVKFAGIERIIAMPLSTADSSTIGQLVVKAYVMASELSVLDEPYQLLFFDGESQTLLCSGTVREAYLSLTLSERIKMFMDYCDPDFGNCPSLPDKVKDFLRVRSDCTPQ